MYSADLNIPGKPEDDKVFPAMNLCLQFTVVVPASPPSIMTGGSQSGPWRKTITDLDGPEDEKDMPWWVIDCVMNHRLPPRENTKCSFYLHPCEGSTVQILTQGKLSAPRILRIHKEKYLSAVLQKLATARAVFALLAVQWVFCEIRNHHRVENTPATKLQKTHRRNHHHTPTGPSSLVTRLLHAPDTLDHLRPESDVDISSLSSLEIFEGVSNLRPLTWKSKPKPLGHAEGSAPISFSATLALCTFSFYHHGSMVELIFIIVSVFYVPGFVALESRVFRKQPLYLHEVINYVVEKLAPDKPLDSENSDGTFAPGMHGATGVDDHPGLGRSLGKSIIHL
ncbi:hypothetical protein MTR67_034957 [Solanum verrucosum]|uniref:Uncharacterized protein n=1 Tax=Solanum verrucosum TaxID=315347 RepID=A0AAF0U912_SOLVR|nr:hypothetical protein MTR67_034957 [Solanum verrucosum]